MRSVPALIERTEMGRAVREKMPRSAHAGWVPPVDRRDPVDVLIESSVDRVADLLPIRYGRMMQSAFASRSP